MKKLLFILLTGLLTLSSCKDTTTLHKKTMTGYVAKQYKESKFDTLLVIREKQVDRKSWDVNLFRKNNQEYIGKFETTDSNPSNILFIGIFGMLVGMGVMGIIKS